MNPIKSGNRDAHALLKLLPVPRGTRCGLRLALAPVLPLWMDCREEDAAIPAYCKDDERQGAQKMPQKAWFLLFPYSIPYPFLSVNLSPAKSLKKALPRREGSDIYAVRRSSAFL